MLMSPASGPPSHPRSYPWGMCVNTHLGPLAHEEDKLLAALLYTSEVAISLDAAQCPNIGHRATSWTCVRESPLGFGAGSVPAAPLLRLGMQPKWPRLGSRCTTRPEPTCVPSATPISAIRSRLSNLQDVLCSAYGTFCNGSCHPRPQGPHTHLNPG